MLLNWTLFVIESVLDTCLSAKRFWSQSIVQVINGSPDKDEKETEQCGSYDTFAPKVFTIFWLILWLVWAKYKEWFLHFLLEIYRDADSVFGCSI
jgi:hypothetical protein